MGTKSNGNGPGYFRSTIRFLATGVDTHSDKSWADGTTDQPGDPGAPVTTTLPGEMGEPWLEGLEDTQAPTGLVASPDPSLPNPDVGKSSIVGAYEGAVRTHGPASYWPGQEVSGGPWGDQALGRRMLFKLPLVQSAPDSSFEGRVTDTGYLDELAAALATNGQGEITDAEVTQHLLLWEGESP